MQRDADVHLELLVVCDGALNTRAELNRDGVGSLERLVDQPAVARSYEILVLNVDVSLGTADVVHVGLLDGIVILAALADVDLVKDVAVELDRVGVDRTKKLTAPCVGIVLGARPIHDEALLLRDVEKQMSLLRILLLPAILEVFEQVQRNLAIVVAMNVVPGLPGAGVTGVRQSDVAVKVILVLGLERLEEGVFGSIITSVGQIDSTHEANDASALGQQSSVGDGRIDQNALLMVS